MYKRLVDPTEEQVSEVLKEGYILHSVSVVKRSEAHLIYHFVKYVAERPLPDFNVYSDENPFKPRFKSKGDNYS
jgi:hypothetical protein